MVQCQYFFYFFGLQNFFIFGWHPLFDLVYLLSQTVVENLSGFTFFFLYNFFYEEKNRFSKEKIYLVKRNNFYL